MLPGGRAGGSFGTQRSRVQISLTRLHREGLVTGPLAAFRYRRPCRLGATASRVRPAGRDRGPGRRGIHRCLVLLGHHLGVEVERHPGIGVAEHCLGRLHVDAGGHQLGRGARRRCRRTQDTPGDVLHGSTVRPCGGRRPWQIRASGVTCVNDGDHRLRGTNGLDTGEPGATGLWRIAGVCCERTWDGFRTLATDRHRDASMCLRGEALRHETPPAARTWGTGPGRTVARTFHCWDCEPG